MIWRVSGRTRIPQSGHNWRGDIRDTHGPRIHSPRHLCGSEPQSNSVPLSPLLLRAGPQRTLPTNSRYPVLSRNQSENPPEIQQGDTEQKKDSPSAGCPLRFRIPEKTRYYWFPAGGRPSGVSPSPGMDRPPGVCGAASAPLAAAFGSTASSRDSLNFSKLSAEIT